MTSESELSSARAASEALVRRRLKAVAAKDFAALGALYPDDVVLEIPMHESGRTEPGSYRVVEGKAAVLAQFEMGAKKFDRMGFVDPDITVSGDGAVVFLEARGDMAAADGTTYCNRYVFRFDVRDGLICRIREYANPVTAALAMGRPIGPQ